MLNPTTLGVDEKNAATTSLVADNRMKIGMKFEDIVHGNHYPRSFAGVNPVIPDQKKHVLQKKQFTRFTPACWNLYLDG